MSKNFQVKEAEIDLHRMVNNGLEPDGFTYNTIIDGYCKQGQIEKINNILKDATYKGYVPMNPHLLVKAKALFYDALYKGGDIDRAKALFYDALGKGLRPSIISD